MKHRYLEALCAGLAGLLFGLGLILAGMANPAKVLAFLDIFGQWDPSLACVMIGAIALAMPAFMWAKKYPYRLLMSGAARLPIVLAVANKIDRKLVLGSVLFGVGWGLVGLCPGPAVVLLTVFPVQAGVFMLAMLAGMAIATAWQK